MQCDPPHAEEAEAHYREALALAEELGMRPLQAHCHLGLGSLYAKIGQQEQARTELSAAIDLYRAMDMTFWLPQAETAGAEQRWRIDPEGKGLREEESHGAHHTRTTTDALCC